MKKRTVRQTPISVTMASIDQPLELLDARSASAFDPMEGVVAAVIERRKATWYISMVILKRIIWRIGISNETSNLL